MALQRRYKKKSRADESPHPSHVTSSRTRPLDARPHGRRGTTHAQGTIDRRDFRRPADEEAPPTSSLPILNGAVAPCHPRLTKPPAGSVASFTASRWARRSRRRSRRPGADTASHLRSRPSPAPGSSPPPAQPDLLDAPTPPTDAFDPWVYQPDTRKVAFLFVVTKGENGLPHDHLWARFFAGQDPNLYAIHVHVPKTFVFNASTTAAPELFKDTEVRSVVEEKTRSGKFLLIIVRAIRVTSCFELVFCS